MKPAKFCTYPCRGVLHTPPNVLRQGFAPKIGRVLGVSLLGRVKSGAFLGASLLGNGKSGAFLAYPDGKIWNPPNFVCTRVGRKSIRPEMILAEGLGLKPGGFWVYPYWDG